MSKREAERMKQGYTLLIFKEVVWWVGKAMCITSGNCFLAHFKRVSVSRSIQLSKSFSFFFFLIRTTTMSKREAERMKQGY